MSVNHKKDIFVCGRMFVVTVTEFDKGLLRGLLLPTEFNPSPDTSSIPYSYPSHTVHAVVTAAGIVGLSHI